MATVSLRARIFATCFTFIFHIHVSWVAHNRKRNPNQDKQEGRFVSLCAWKVQEKSRHQGDWSSSSCYCTFSALLSALLWGILAPSMSGSQRTGSCLTSNSRLERGKAWLPPQHRSRNPDWARLDHVQMNMMQKVSQSMCCSALVIQAHYALEASLCKRRVCEGRSGNLGTLSKREGLQ